ncbi:hypothetical protein B0H19DRAFT_1274968 [Mycena capillaripes]|nr:hypothetical protein B0H19DRAFT_1274968 [Mycena capillaripes]
MDNHNKLLEALPDLLACKNINGKALPTEVLIRKKGFEEAIIWNSDQRLSNAITEVHIVKFVTLTLHLALMEHSAQSTAGVKVSTWITGGVLFKLAVMDPKEAQSHGAAAYGAEWLHVLAAAEG